MSAALDRRPRLEDNAFPDATGSGFASRTHLVLIPSFNSGTKLLETVAAAQQQWQPVWVVIDGSTDGSDKALGQADGRSANLRILTRDANGGKGAAVLDGLRAAEMASFTHVLVMDADCQHPAASIPRFMSLSHTHPDSMILGVPIFDRTAPRLRVVGRRVSNNLARLETLGAIEDSLFGFRIYPIKPLRQVMEQSRFMRRFDFDVEATVRLWWHGVPAINVPAPVRYFAKAEGGISHFRYLRDNVLLTVMHLRLLAGFLPRLPMLLRRRARSSRH